MQAMNSALTVTYPVQRGRLSVSYLLHLSFAQPHSVLYFENKPRASCSASGTHQYTLVFSIFQPIYQLCQCLPTFNYLLMVNHPLLLPPIPPVFPRFSPPMQRGLAPYSQIYTRKLCARTRPNNTVLTHRHLLTQASEET